MEELQNQKPIKKVFSRIGFALCVMLLLTAVLQVVWFAVGKDNWMAGSSWGMWLGTFVPLYLVGAPVCCLMLRPLPAAPPAEQKIGIRKFLTLLPICYFLTYAGSLAGTMLSQALSGGEAQNALENYAFDTNPIKILVMVILAPLVEEFIFRKLIIDRTAKYGEKLAVVLSALAFGLFHTNLYQFFYAFALGLVFGYIYVRTGRLRYTAVIHGIINFLGSVLAPFILSTVDLEALSSIDPNATEEELLALYSGMMPGILYYFLYVVFLLAVVIAGFVLFLRNIEKLPWKEAPEQLPKGKGVRTAYLNAGMIVFLLICSLFTVLALF